MSRTLKRLFIAIMFLALPLLVAGCYEPDTEYKAIDVGQLKTPEKAELNSSEYREKYDPLGRYEETITLDVAVCQFPLEAGVKPGLSPENQTFNDLALEKLNIKLNYVVVSNSAFYDQKLNLYFATGKTPDMFYTTNNETYSSLADRGKLADLTETFWYLNDELQENYLTHFPELLPACMKEGKLYSLPTITNTYATAQRLYIRQDWLDIVGMEAPTTMEEFYAVGKAFVENKDKIAAATGIAPNRVIPFTMNKEVTWAGSYSIEGFLNCYGTSVDAYFDDGDGELYFSNTSKEMKNALTMLRKMYSEGILDKDFVTKTAEQIQANIKAGYVGMAFGEWWMPKDVLDDCISNIDESNWTWVNLPSAEGVDAKPIVPAVNISGYNVVSSECEYPEACAKLINLFYDIYYSDDAQEKYGDKVLPSNGFYYQFVPIKLWDGIASIREYERVQEVFDKLYASGFNPANYVDSATYAEQTIIQKVSESQVQKTDYVISIIDGVASIINRDVISAINANPIWSELFYTMRNREKTLHFVDGYPYFVAYKNGKKLSEMSKGERRGWGIYHEMVDPTGGYAYVVELTKTKNVKYDRFYGANLEVMKTYSSNITKQTNVMFTKIIIGQMGLDEFDTTYAKDQVDKKGGNEILTEVNKWYKEHNIDTSKVYELIKDYNLLKK